MSPTDPATYCPVCGLFWYVHGCKPGACKTPPREPAERERREEQARRYPRDGGGIETPGGHFFVDELEGAEGKGRP